MNETPGFSLYFTGELPQTGFLSYFPARLSYLPSDETFSLCGIKPKPPHFYSFHSLSSVISPVDDQVLVALS